MSEQATEKADVEPLPIAEWQETITHIHQTCQAVMFDEGAPCSAADVELVVACFIHEQIPQDEIRSLLLALWNGEEITQTQHAGSIQVDNATKVLSTIQTAVLDLALGNPSDFNKVIVGRLIFLYNSPLDQDDSSSPAVTQTEIRLAPFQEMQRYFALYSYFKSTIVGLFLEIRKALHNHSQEIHKNIEGLVNATLSQIDGISDSTKCFLINMWDLPTELSRYPSLNILEFEPLIEVLAPLHSIIKDLSQLNPSCRLTKLQLIIDRAISPPSIQDFYIRLQIILSL